MSDESERGPRRGDLVWWHNPSEKGRHAARRGTYYEMPDGSYVIPRAGGDPVAVSSNHVHHINAELSGDTCVLCPLPAASIERS
jgi:hypothetical protein